MLIDTDLVFDDLEGYAFFHKAEISAIIEDKVKCADGEIIEFLDSVECSFSEGDEIIILEKKETPEELKSFYNFCKKQGNQEILPLIEKRMDAANEFGVYKSYIALFDDQTYEVYSFRL